MLALYYIPNSILKIACLSWLCYFSVYNLSSIVMLFSYINKLYKYLVFYSKVLLSQISFSISLLRPLLGTIPLNT